MQICQFFVSCSIHRVSSNRKTRTCNINFVVFGFVPQMSQSFAWIAASGTCFESVLRAKIFTSGILKDQGFSPFYCTNRFWLASIHQSSNKKFSSFSSEIVTRVQVFWIFVARSIFTTAASHHYFILLSNLCVVPGTKRTLSRQKILRALYSRNCKLD